MMNLRRRRSFTPPSVLPDISPSRGEIACIYASPSYVGDWRNHSDLPISPLEGEMSGRTEGGNMERDRSQETPRL